MKPREVEKKAFELANNSTKKSAMLTFMLSVCSIRTLREFVEEFKTK